jgi:hypothetical protein
LAGSDGATQAAASASASEAAAAAAATAWQGTVVGQGSGALDSAVLSIMGASLQAMWDAVGEEGMRPFVVRVLWA